FENVIERAVFVGHFCENVVRRAVDDSVDRQNPIGCKRFLERLDDWNATANTALKSYRHAGTPGRGVQFSAVNGKQCFVRGHNVFATSDCGKEQFLCGIVTTDQFDNDIDVGIICNM